MNNILQMPYAKPNPILETLRQQIRDDLEGNEASKIRHEKETEYNKKISDEIFEAINIANASKVVDLLKKVNLNIKDKDCNSLLRVAFANVLEEMRLRYQLSPSANVIDTMLVLINAFEEQTYE